MAEVYRVFVESSKMLSIFSSVDLILPYRFQPNVMLSIDFNEYKKFIGIMLSAHIHCLSFDNSLYEKALYGNKNVYLTKVFYFDLSKAVANELVLAIANKSDATIICNTFSREDVRSIRLENIKQELQYVKKDCFQKSVESVKRDLNNYIGNCFISNHNALIFYYAILLRTFSYMECPEKINII